MNLKYCMPVHGHCHVSLYDCLAHWYTQLKYVLDFQLWHHEEMRAESLFLPSHTMMPSNASVHEESYKYCIVWYLLEILHNADFTTQIFLHLCTSKIIEICTVLRCYTACSCNFWPTFRDNLWVPSLPLKTEPIDCLETSARNCHYTLCNIPEERRSHLLWGRSMKSTISTISLKKEPTLCKWMYFCKFQVLMFTFLCYVCCFIQIWRLDPIIPLSHLFF